MVAGSGIALGCDGGGGGGPGGGGGTGGSGGAGGAAGGSGGQGGGETTSSSSLDACPVEYDGTPEEVGFGDLVADAENMLVETVTPTALELKRQSGEVVTFAWTGPDLTATFSAGQTVNVNAGGVGWDTVATDSMFAAAFYYNYFGGSGGIQPCPLGGPSVTPQVVCGSASAGKSDLLVQLEGEQVTAHYQETVTLADYTVRNGGILDWTSISDYGTHSSIMVLGPLAGAE
jgi:hypothetical protein